MRVRCPLCRMLNIIAELKKHPNESGFFHLSIKANRLLVNKEGVGDICDDHRLPIHFTADITSVTGYINEVQRIATGLATGEIRAHSYDDDKRRMMS